MGKISNICIFTNFKKIILTLKYVKIPIYSKLKDIQTDAPALCSGEIRSYNK